MSSSSELATVRVNFCRPLESAATSKSHVSTHRKSADLPHGAHRENLWKGAFLPTLLEYLGRMDDPWTVSDHDFVHMLQEIWKEVYGARLIHDA